MSSAVCGLPVVQVAEHLGRTVHATEALLVRARARAAFRVAYEDPPTACWTSTSWLSTQRARIVLLAADGVAARDIDEVAVVLATLHPPPQRPGVTHWSSRLLADQLGISHVRVGKIWRKSTPSTSTEPTSWQASAPP